MFMLTQPFSSFFFFCMDDLYSCRTRMLGYHLHRGYSNTLFHVGICIYFAYFISHIVNQSMKVIQTYLFFHLLMRCR